MGARRPKVPYTPCLRSCTGNDVLHTFLCLRISDCPQCRTMWDSGMSRAAREVTVHQAQDVPVSLAGRTEQFECDVPTSAIVTALQV